MITAATAEQARTVLWARAMQRGSRARDSIMSKQDRTDELGDIALAEELVFSPCGLVLERIPTDQGKSPDGGVLKYNQRRALCEIKSPRDDELIDELAAARGDDPEAQRRCHQNQQPRRAAACPPYEIRCHPVQRAQSRSDGSQRAHHCQPCGWLARRRSARGAHGLLLCGGRREICHRAESRGRSATRGAARSTSTSGSTASSAG